MFRRIDVNCVTYERSCARPRVTAVSSGLFPQRFVGSSQDNKQVRDKVSAPVEFRCLRASYKPCFNDVQA